MRHELDHSHDDMILAELQRIESLEANTERLCPNDFDSISQDDYEFRAYRQVSPQFTEDHRPPYRTSATHCETRLGSDTAQHGHLNRRELGRIYRDENNPTSTRQIPLAVRDPRLRKRQRCENRGQDWLRLEDIPDRNPEHFDRCSNFKRSRKNEPYREDLRTLIPKHSNNMI